MCHSTFHKQESIHEASVLGNRMHDSALAYRIDPITMDRLYMPAVSPYGHVMGQSTWTAVLKEKPLCPFTQRALRRDQVCMHGIDRGY